MEILLSNGITLFEKEGECISENSFKVFQVLNSGEALANEVKQGYLIPTGLTVLFLNEDGQSYYDDQVIKIPLGKCAKQIGIFKYSAKSGMEKTVPIVGIRNKYNCNSSDSEVRLYKDFNATLCKECSTLLEEKSLK